MERPGNYFPGDQAPPPLSLRAQAQLSSKNLLSNAAKQSLGAAPISFRIIPAIAIFVPNMAP